MRLMLWFSFLYSTLSHVLISTRLIFFKTALSVLVRLVIASHLIVHLMEILGHEACCLWSFRLTYFGIGSRLVNGQF